MWLYAVKLQKILQIEEFSLYYSDIKTSNFYTKFFKERIDKNIEDFGSKMGKLHDT